MGGIHINSFTSIEQGEEMYRTWIPEGCKMENMKGNTINNETGRKKIKYPPHVL